MGRGTQAGPAGPPPLSIVCKACPQTGCGRRESGGKRNYDAHCSVGIVIVFPPNARPRCGRMLQNPDVLQVKSKLLEAGRETGLGEPRCIRAASISRSTCGLPAFSATRATPLPAATRLKTFTAASRSGFRGPTSQKDASDSQKVLSKRGRHMSTAVTLTVQISAGMLLRKVLPPTRTGLSQTGASGSNTFSDTMER